jgi:hypothetical protein
VAKQGGYNMNNIGSTFNESNFHPIGKDTWTAKIKDKTYTLKKITADTQGLDAFTKILAKTGDNWQISDENKNSQITKPKGTVLTGVLEYKYNIDITKLPTEK